MCPASLARVMIAIRLTLAAVSCATMFLEGGLRKTKRESSAEHEQKLLQGTADYPGICLWVQYIRILHVQYCLNLTKVLN